MEEINLKELFDYFKERVLVILMVILIVLVLGCIYSIFLKTPMYSSTAQIVLVSDDGAAGGNTVLTQNDINLSRSLVTTYSEIIKSRRIIDPVIEELSLDCNYEQLLNTVTISTTTDTEIINVSVKNADRALAADIANEIVSSFSNEIKNIYKLQNVSVVDKAVEAENSYNTNIIKDLIIYMLVGIVLALAIVFIIYYFDTSIKSAEEIENKLGIPVYGIVPRVKHREKK